jgi:hypothetical protein
MRFSLFVLCLLSFPLLGAGSVDFTNDREEGSFYDSVSNQKKIIKALEQIDQSVILGAFNEVESGLEEKRLCAYDVNALLTTKLRATNNKFSEFEGAVLYLRSQNQIDDSVVKLLFLANTVDTTVLLPRKKENTFLPSDKKVVDESISLIAAFDKNNERNFCLDDAYKRLYGDILKIDKTLKTYHIGALFFEALKKNKISRDIYVKLERARINGLENSHLNLRSYYKKIKSLRLQFPLRDPNEKSSFVTTKISKQKVSYRQKLMEEYSDIQIILMADIIKKLRKRLESPKAEILIYERENVFETIALEPMERFRLAIKLLRKEMSLLALNSYFSGRAPDYLDLMSAAYEVGMIPAIELQEVSGLEEIWNPKKSFWEKALVWVRTFSSIATIVIPPPFGFIPTIAIVVIEMTAGKTKEKIEDPTVLF